MRYRVNRRTGDRITEIGGCVGKPLLSKISLSDGAFCGMMCLEVGIWLN